MLMLESADELRGINTRIDLADVARLMRTRRNRTLMLSGVTLEDPTRHSSTKTSRLAPTPSSGPA
jgi:bifunctional N-acetylglucosamine-1-phosphate-uridyltransferase/glucosamine-1-phosphate-acetyltransferase GlmU-like protein